MHIRKKGSAFGYRVIIDRKEAVEFLKSVGFQETDNPDVFCREERRSAKHRVAAARYLVTVDVSKLTADLAAWRAFVHRNRRHAR